MGKSLLLQADEVERCRNVALFELDESILDSVTGGNAIRADRLTIVCTPGAGCGPVTQDVTDGG